MINQAITLQGQTFGKEYSNTAAIGTTEPTSLYHVPITDADVSNTEFFNRLKVMNNSSVSLAVRFNGHAETSEEETIPSGMMGVWDKEDGIKFWGITIKNLSAITDIGIGEVIVNIKRVN